MMQFSIGDKVVHPIHGSGLVTGVEHQELVEGFEHYYVVEIAGRGLTVFVPMCKADELGVRPATSRAGLDRILRILYDKPQRLPEDHKTRQSRVQEKLTSGSLIQVAEVVRNLTWQERLERLTRADSRLLGQGRDLLAAEMALVTDSAVDDAHEVIDAALARGMTKDCHQEAGGWMSALPGEPTGAGTEQQGLMDSLRRHATEALSLRAN
jgi:CarD family transcriptional regulator